MKKCVCGVWLYLLSLGMWGCALDEEVAAEGACEGTECESDVACTRSVCVGSTAHICINGSVFVRFCEYGCNAESGSCLEPSCNPDLLCTKNTCEGNILKICNGGMGVQWKDCGAAGCNPMTGTCNSNGEVGTACDRLTYKQTCINNGANALVCWDDVVTKWDCSGGCLDAGYDPAKPLQVNCWRSSPCCGDPSNTLPNPKGDLTVSGASCDPGTYYGACSDDFTKRYYCGKDNTVVENSCNNGCDPASLGNNSSKCKSGGGSTCTGEKVTTGGTAGESCCDTATYQVSCINSNANALICSGGTVKQWDCKDSQCSVADNRVTCPNPNGSGSSAECTGETVSTGGVVGQCCDAENYNPAGCNPSSNSGLRCSNGIIKEWTCKENQTCSYDSAKKWYSCN